MNKESTLDVSVIIVNYNVKHFLDQCLRSVTASIKDLDVEILVVDNASTDGSIEYLRPRFPNVEFIVNTENVGFGRANNLALSRARGRYLLVLNPDTLLGEDTLTALVRFMDSTPRAGVVSPKILDRYGDFDKTSKRGLPTPWVTFCRISGLSKLFPRSALLGRYDLLYLDPDQSAIVDALPGSSMFVRREAYLQTRGFDEDYFMYGEDIDWCYRIQLAGWEVWYAPVTKIVHFRGESTRRSNIDRDRAFYGAMHLFVDKHFKSRTTWLGHQLIDFGILLAHGAARISRIWRRTAAPLADWTGLWLIFVTARWLRTLPFWDSFGLTVWLSIGWSWMAVIAITIQSSVWVGALASSKVYTQGRGQVNTLLRGFFLGFLVNSSFTFFFRQFAYSRFATLFAAIFGLVYVLGWRRLYQHAHRSQSIQNFLRRRALIVGIGELGRKVLTRIRGDGKIPYQVVGFIDPGENAAGQIIDELPVIGVETDLERLVRQEEIEDVIFACEETDYRHILDLVSSLGESRQVNFKIISADLIDQAEQLPLLTVEYLRPRGLKKSLRRITSLAFRR